MHIAVDGREFVSGRTTGIARYLESLLSPLASDPNISIHILASDPQAVPLSLTADNTSIETIPPSCTLTQDCFLLPRMAKRLNTDVFFSPYYKAPMHGSFRRITTIHDIMFLRLSTTHPLKRLLISLRLRMSVARSDIILVDSDFTGKDLAAFAPHAANKSITVYPQLPQSWSSSDNLQDPQETRTTYSDGQPFLLYVGNFKPHKNVDKLIEAFAGLDRTNLPCQPKLILAGGDSLHQKHIEQTICRANIADNVTVLRDVSDHDLRNLYHAADWFITASSYEGFGYPPVEAMAMGCPVICHPNTSLKEIAANAGLQIPSLATEDISATIHKALLLPQSERTALIAAGRQKSATFSSNNSSTIFRNALQSLANNPD